MWSSRALAGPGIAIIHPVKYFTLNIYTIENYVNITTIFPVHFRGTIKNRRFDDIIGILLIVWIVVHYAYDGGSSDGKRKSGIPGRNLKSPAIRPTV